MGDRVGVDTAGDMPGLDAVEQRSWRSFLDASLRVSAALNRELTVRHGLTLADVRLLEILHHSESGWARMGELAAELLALPSRVTRQIRRLETAGLVRRQASPDDGRGVLAGITAPGRAAVTAAMATYAANVRDLYLSPLTRTQMSGLGENCRRIGAALQAEGIVVGLGRV